MNRDLKFSTGIAIYNNKVYLSGTFYIFYTKQTNQDKEYLRLSMMTHTLTPSVGRV